MDYQPKSLDIKQIEPRPIMTDITVVIPTLGRPILEESLYWIATGTAWPGCVIVVDQGSSTQVAALMEKMYKLGIEAQHVPSSQRGRAAGINRGLERIRTRFVAITDDDCFVEADWLEQMVNCLRQHPDAVVTGRVEAGTEDVIVVVTSRVPSVQRRPNLTFDHMSGGNMGTSKSVLERVGLFDEHPSLRTSEDGEWSYRALRAGVSIYYTPDACVRHFGWRDESKREVQYRDYAHSHGGFYGKYLRQGDWFIAVRAVLHHLRALRRWVKGTVTGDLEAASYGRAYVTGLLPGIMAGLRREETV
jgi:GT2 family glycosyltransferase